jgi:8-oxo-dGTP pyrophosphatase MutT (NUDIX family)
MALRAAATCCLKQKQLCGPGSRGRHDREIVFLHDGLFSQVHMTRLISQSVGLATLVVTRVRRLARVGRWPLTLGVRAAVLDDRDRVMLVRHTYAPGWHFPGGGVDPRETLAQAAVRELHEEALIAARDEPTFFGMYLSLVDNKSDHIGLFIVRNFEVVTGRMRVLEIAEARFFPVTALPEGTTGGTRRRLGEILAGTPRSATW